MKIASENNETRENFFAKNNINKTMFKKIKIKTKIRPVRGNFLLRL